MAYAEPLEQASARHMRAWKVWLVAGDCFLIGLAPVLVHMSKGLDGKFPFHPVSINLLVEVAKTFFATVVIMIYVSPLGCPHSEVPSAHCHILGENADAFLICAACWLHLVNAT